MLNEWIPLRRYELLRASEDPETLQPWTHYTHWFGLRRVRTFLAIGGLLLLIFSLTQIFDLRARLHIPQYKGDAVLEAGNGVNWTDFAYVQYVTNANYLCNSLMILEALHRYGAKADRIMMYPEEWHVPKDNGTSAVTESRLLAQARDLYKTKLVPIKVQTIARGDPTWKDSYTKLLAFNQTQYKRLISLDSDATVKQNMDELFMLPSSPVAMPRAYWLDQPFLSSQLIVLEPSQFEWQRIQDFMTHDDSGFDMDILNKLYKESCTVLPHRRYNMLSAEFRTQDHSKYLGSNEPWDGPRALEEAKFVHFSDWPVPKPWIKAGESVVTSHQPKCVERGNDGGQECADRDIWLELYRDFSERRQQICGRSYDRKRNIRHSEASSPSIPPKYELIVV